MYIIGQIWGVQNFFLLIISGAIPLMNLSWNQTSKNDQLFVAKLDAVDNNFDGLRVNGLRAVRARYPNANPELDGFGSNLFAIDWFPSIIEPMPETEIYSVDYPIRNESATNEFVYYQAGIGGICDAFDPPMGYWCGTKTVCLQFDFSKTINFIFDSKVVEVHTFSPFHIIKYMDECIISNNLPSTPWIDI